MDDLVHGIMQANCFNEDIPLTWSCKRVCELLDNSNSAASLPFAVADGWTEHSVELLLPCWKSQSESEVDTPKVTISGIWLCDPIELLKSAVKDMSFLSAHLKGFKQMWKPSDDCPAMRVHCEAYMLDLYWDLEAELIASTSQSNIETVILSIKGFSNSTMLTNFGSASSWPIYWFLGCLSKYHTAKPCSHTAHHLAYIPLVWDHIFLDWYL